MLQIAAVTHCTNHCASCDLADTEAILGDCLVDAATMSSPGYPLPGGQWMPAIEIVRSHCAAGRAIISAISRTATVATDSWPGPHGAYIHAFSASSFGKPVTMVFDAISADEFSMRIIAPVSSMSKFCPSEAYTYSPSANLAVAGYQTAGDCIHDALGLVHINIKSFDYNKDTDSIDIKYKLFFMTHTITLTKGA